jgi:ATP-dependent DNA helicase RecQ
LSCIYRVRQASGFDFGANQIAEVLTGADTENVRKWNHQKVSTYGIGREHNRAEWKAIGRELIRLGFVRQQAEKFNAVALTPEGLAALKQRKPVTLAYIVFSDVALRQMARVYPANEHEFARISGVGEKKLREFGAVFLAEIAAYLQTNPRQIFADDSFAAPAPLPGRARLGSTTRESLRRFHAGQSVDEIAAQRNLTMGTIYGHLAEALSAGEAIDVNRFLTAEEQREVAIAFNLTGVFESLAGRYDYGRLRLFRAAMHRQ